MPIKFDENTRQFHLYNNDFSYIIAVYDNGSIGQLYFGEPLSPDRDHPFLAPLPFAGFSNNIRSAARFEYPCYGQGDFRLPAFKVKLADGAGVVEPRFEDYRVYAGKKALPGLPSTYTESDDEAETLEIILIDKPSHLKIILFYTIFAADACIARSVRFENFGKEKIILESAMSLSLDAPDSAWNTLAFTGSWAREFAVSDAPLHVGFQGVHSSLGVSGSTANPSLVFRRPETTERYGEAFGISLLYSGNFIACAEIDCWDIVRIRVGINPETFSWSLENSGSFDAPEAVLGWSRNGLNGLSRVFHRLFRTRLERGVWRDRERPVLLNNWEGTYFNFNEEKLLAMAKKAADMGVELFALDDGWFGKRDDDATSLGDWFPNTDKLPNGITGLAEKITAMGLKFGLWIEPEMVSEKSRLFEAHPDWAVGVPGRTRTEIRRQFVLDMGRSEVVDYLFETLSALISNAKISYIKWDMNRFITEPFSLALPPDRQGEFFHRYCLGVYSLYSRLTEAFPDILFESCASGGARFDGGILAFAPQGWLSDDTDAVQRLEIQRGASYFYPLNCIGAHISAVPNHQTGRLTSLLFRAAVAFFGDLGFELDPTKLAEEEAETVKECIAFYKERRRLFQQGVFNRLDAPPDCNTAAWMVSTEDKKSAIAAVYKLNAKPNQKPFRIKLAGLDRSKVYRVSLWEPTHRAGAPFDATDKRLNCGLRGGDELLSCGLLIDNTFFAVSITGDFYPELFLIEEAGEAC
ncbi:MAG: alpha-galactosidase [Treponema sp.]|jgi:alpha-galactosidase|nr:alpha-galactosidase [Treponema sp.]